MSYSRPRNNELTVDGALDRADERGDRAVAAATGLVETLRRKRSGSRVVDVFSAVRDNGDSVLVVWDDDIAIIGPSPGDYWRISTWDYRAVDRVQPNTDVTFRLIMQDNSALTFQVAPGSGNSFWSNAMAQAD